MFLTRLPTTLAHLYHLLGWLKMYNPPPHALHDLLLPLHALLAFTISVAVMLHLLAGKVWLVLHVHSTARHASHCCW